MIEDKYKYYQILELNQNASKEEIKTNFKNLAKKWHPDKNKEKEDFCKEMFIKIYTAYQVLSNDETKREYDRYLQDLKTANAIDNLIYQEQIFNEWLKISKKDAIKKYKDFKTKGDDFIDIIINFSIGVFKITQKSIKKIIDTGKKTINNALSENQKETIKKISKNTLSKIKFFFKSLFNTILFSFIGLAIGWIIGKNFVDEKSSELLMNIIWLAFTLIGLVYYFIIKYKPKVE